MLFFSESACTWRSKCGRYQIVHHVAGFGLQVYLCHVEGREGAPHPETRLDLAQDWCRLDAEPVPEMDFATHSDMQR